MSNVLLIEPNRVLARTYYEALSYGGHTVQACGTAQAAIMAADELNPDVVVLELQLVAHSGAEFLYEFRSYPDWQQVPVVVHTQIPPTQFSESFRATQQQLGIVSYLYKPRTDLQALLTAVNQATTIHA
jgi:CheY-like chemotaxis protein